MNNPLLPEDVFAKSGKKVWWNCSNGHEWEAAICNRAAGRGCPYCSGRKVSADNNLRILYPRIAKQWHHAKNGDLTTEDVSPGMSRKVWWLCSKRHEWEATIASRTRGNGCPYCSGREISTEAESLNAVNPKLAKEWHPTKNDPLTPKQISPKSNRKVWWKCQTGHEWETSVSHRAAGTGCPFCANRAVTKRNSLSYLYPTLSTQWHPQKNAPLNPEHVVPGSAKKVWWQCGEKHVWEASVRTRVGGLNCPYCSGFYASSTNNLAVVNPTLAREWHPTKNGSLLPEEVTPASAKKAWWRCNRGHDWKTAVSNRAVGSGCPFCSGQTSKPEIRIFTELSTLFDYVSNREKINGIEIDVYIKKYQLALEYDGYFFHSARNENDLIKNKKLANAGIRVIRVRERPLESISDEDISVPGTELKKKNIDEILRRILPYLDDADSITVEKYLFETRFQSNNAYRKFLSYLPGPPPSNSLAKKHPSIAKQWHGEKNHPLKPTQFSVGSTTKIWWKCENNHEWQAAISTRTRGSGCPYCSGNAVSSDNNLAANFPHLANEWHPTKNASLAPTDFTPGSGIKVWWICSNRHEWKTAIYTRTSGGGCPYCSNRRVNRENCLASLNPELTKEWSNKNLPELSPEMVTPGSNKKVWWTCEKGHEWQARIVGRVRGRGCPHCAGWKKSQNSGRKIGQDYNLAHMFPEIAGQFHPTKNNPLTAFDLAPKSHRKVWWQCDKGHIWKAVVANRTAGRNCPKCWDLRRRKGAATRK